MKLVNCCLMFITLTIVGCGAEPGPVAKDEPSVPASGVVLFKGKPLPEYRVVVMPVDGRRPAMGATDAEGKFALGTNKPGDGAPAGSSKVGIVWAGPEQVGEAVDQSAIDDPAKMPKPKVVIPAKYANPETSGLTVDIPAGGTSDLKFDLQ